MRAVKWCTWAHEHSYSTRSRQIGRLRWADLIKTSCCPAVYCLVCGWKWKIFMYNNQRERKREGEGGTTTSNQWTGRVLRPDKKSWCGGKVITGWTVYPLPKWFHQINHHFRGLGQISSEKMNNDSRHHGINRCISESQSLLETSVVISLTWGWIKPVCSENKCTNNRFDSQRAIYTVSGNNSCTKLIVFYSGYSSLTNYNWVNW